MATKIRVGPRPVILDNRAYGPGVHEIEDPEIVRRLKLRGATEVTGDEAADEASTSAPADTDQLPEDFPARKQLIANGIKTREQLGALTKGDLVAMEGIGDVTADRILEARADLGDEQ